MRKIIVFVVAAAFVFFLIRSVPESFSTDLSRIGGAPVTAVAVHDVNLVDSTAMMDLVDRLHGEYGDDVLFLVADVNAPDGRAFAQAHAVRAATIVLFDHDAEKIGVIPGAAEGATVRRTIDEALADRAEGE